MHQWERIQVLWGLSDSEAALLTRGSADALADLEAATNLLAKRLKRERIHAVVRRPAELLGGRSLYDLAMAGAHREVREAVASMFDLRRTE